MAGAGMPAAAPPSCSPAPTDPPTCVSLASRPPACAVAAPGGAPWPRSRTTGSVTTSPTPTGPSARNPTAQASASSSARRGVASGRRSTGQPSALAKTETRSAGSVLGASGPRVSVQTVTTTSELSADLVTPLIREGRIRRLKFRTTVISAGNLDDAVNLHETDRMGLRGLYDSRVTRVGRFLRPLLPG